MRTRKAAWFLLLSGSIGTAYDAKATLTPEDYPLVKASEVEEIDPALDSWLETYSVERSKPIPLSESDRTGLRNFLVPMQTPQGLTRQGKKELESYFGKLETDATLWQQFQQDPLASVLLEEILRSNVKIKNFQVYLGRYLQTSTQKSGAQIRLSRSFYWLVPTSASTASPPERPRKSPVDWVQQALRGKNCDEYQRNLMAKWQQPPASLELEKEIEYGDAVVRCNKNKGTSFQDHLWENFSPALVKQFGTPVLSWLAIKRARVLWNGNQDSGAWQMLEKIRNTPEDPARADALLLSARMKENTNAEAEAVSLYNEFVTQFPTHADAGEAQKALASLYAKDEKWSDVLRLCEAILLREDSKNADDRSPSDAGFSLLWGGRAYHNLGEESKAREFWARLMTEYYSTYYGALGQYLVEQMDKQSYAVYPAYTQAFKTSQFFGAYDNTENTGFLTRALFYMETSRWSEARYEIQALGEEMPEQKAAKSLLLYALGDWLPAIQLFGDVPRSLRNTLPRGMERIVFPRRYKGEVLAYAEKVKIDPDFVFSLIRQESVFNPNASSPAGAKGLMQLMEPTAKREAASLSSPYATHKEKNYAVGMTKKTKGQGLFNSKLNLMLGVHHLNGLLEKYKNPVFTLSAYNAGPAPTARWMEKYPTQDILYFIEKIPYKETQGYVKLILRNYFCYKKWYATSKRFPPIDKILDRLFVHAKPIEPSAYALD